MQLNLQYFFSGLQAPPTKALQAPPTIALFNRLRLQAAMTMPRQRYAPLCVTVGMGLSAQLIYNIA